MLTYEDAIGDENLYATWLTIEHEHDNLAAMTTNIIKGGGYTIPPDFDRGLSKMHSVTLAGFIAANWPYETDDSEWLAYCRATYPPTDEPTETDEERNGAMSTFRLGE